MTCTYARILSLQAHYKFLKFGIFLHHKKSSSTKIE